MVNVTRAVSEPRHKRLGRLVSSPQGTQAPKTAKRKTGGRPIARRRRRSAHGWSRKRSNQLPGATEDGAPCALGHVTDRQGPEDGGGNRGSSHIYTHTWVYAREVYYGAHVCVVSSASEDDASDFTRRNADKLWSSTPRRSEMKISQF